jgi:hypothetical protein
LIRLCFEDITMSRLARLILNLSIGAKLGIASGLGVLMVAALVIGQMRANTMTRQLDAASRRSRPSRGTRWMQRRRFAACRPAFAICVSPAIRQI